MADPGKDWTSYQEKCVLVPLAKSSPASIHPIWVSTPNAESVVSSFNKPAVDLVASTHRLSQVARIRDRRAAGLEVSSGTYRQPALRAANIAIKAWGDLG